MRTLAHDLGRTVARLARGPLGGDVQIGARTSEGWRVPDYAGVDNRPQPTVA